MTTPPQRDRMFNAVALLLYAGFVLLVTAHHEPWRDEADVWLMVLNNDFTGLTRLLPYAGSPGLWHAIVYPVARAGLPYSAMLAVNNGIAIAAAGVILFRAPFPRLTRVLIIFSYYAAFEYAVVARPYALTVLLAVCLCDLYPARYRKPVAFGCVLALLFNTSVLAGIVAGAMLLLIFADFNREKGARVAALIAGLGLFLAVLQVWPPDDGQESFDLFKPHWNNAFVALTGVVIPARLEGSVLGLFIGAALSVVAVAAVGVTLRRSRRALAFIVLTFAGFLFLFVWVYFGDVWHSGMVAAALLMAAWIARSESIAVPRVTAVVIHLALAASCAFTVLNACREWTRPFSDARNLARFILDHNLADKTIAGFPDPHASSVKAFLPDTRFWYAGMQAYGSHMLWNADYLTQRKLPYEEAMRRIEAQFPDRTNLLVLLDTRRMESPNYRLIYQTPVLPFRDNGERYGLYEPVPVSRKD